MLKQSWALDFHEGGPRFESRAWQNVYFQQIDALIRKPSQQGIAKLLGASKIGSSRAE